MPASAREKARKYEMMLSQGLEAAAVAPREETPLARIGANQLEMAEAYLADGRTFIDAGDWANALAAFSYGHGWLDAGVRAGTLTIDGNEDVFAI